MFLEILQIPILVDFRLFAVRTALKYSVILYVTSSFFDIEVIVPLQSIFFFNLIFDIYFSLFKFFFALFVSTIVITYCKVKYLFLNTQIFYMKFHKYFTYNMKHVGLELDRLIRERFKGREIELAKIMGMTRQNLSNIKKKESIDSGQLERFCNALEISPNYFFEESETFSCVAEPIVEYKKTSKEDSDMITELRERISLLEDQLKRANELNDMYKNGQIVVVNKARSRDAG